MGAGRKEATYFDAWFGETGERLIVSDSTVEVPRIQPSWLETEDWSDLSLHPHDDDHLQHCKCSISHSLGRCALHRPQSRATESCRIEISAFQVMTVDIALLACLLTPCSVCRLFQKQFLIVYGLMVAAEWVQGRI